MKYIILLSFVLIQIYLLFIHHHYSLDIDVSPNEIPSQNIYGEFKSGQSFVAQRDNLARIDVIFGTHGRANTKNIFFRLWEIQSGRSLVAELTVNAAEVINNHYFPLEFPPIKDSRDKSFLFVFSSPGSTPDNSVCVWMNSGNIYNDGHYYLKNTIAPGDLAFRVYSKRPIFSELKRIGRNYSGIFSRSGVLILVIAIFIPLQLLVLMNIIDVILGATRGPGKPQEGETHV